MKLLIILLTLLSLVGCATKENTVNKEICKKNEQSNTLSIPRECKVYDEDAAAKASLPAIERECKKCLEKRGYELK